jgi:hypothetical protein
LVVQLLFHGVEAWMIGERWSWRRPLWPDGGMALELDWKDCGKPPTPLVRVADVSA